MKEGKRKFLSDNEYDFILRRIEKDRADVALEPFSLKKYLSAALDINIWGFGWIYYSSTTTAYAVTYFLPSIYVKGMGFSQGAALCLYAPPYAAAGILMCVTSWIGDKYRIRAPILIFNALVTITGLPLLVWFPVDICPGPGANIQVPTFGDSLFPRSTFECWCVGANCSRGLRAEYRRAWLGPFLPQWAAMPTFQPQWPTK